nr:lytic polysaccharide monooxygenase [Methylococcus capsulatus]
MRVTPQKIRNRRRARWNILKLQIGNLDQAAYRSAELQDGMGQKVLPAILEVVPCLRQKRCMARNAIAHGYPDDPGSRASAINVSSTAQCGHAARVWVISATDHPIFHEPHRHHPHP